MPFAQTPLNTPSIPPQIDDDAVCTEPTRRRTLAVAMGVGRLIGHVPFGVQCSLSRVCVLGCHLMNRCGVHSRRDVEESACELLYQ
eukprot:5568794-Pyramimonas_sp.AAC.1